MCPKYLVTFWGILKNITFSVKTFVVMFGQLLEEIGLLYNLTAGHTGQLSFSTSHFRRKCKAISAS